MDLNNYSGELPTFVLNKLAWITETVFLHKIQLRIRLIYFASWQDIGGISNFPVFQWITI